MQHGFVGGMVLGIMAITPLAIADTVIPDGGKNNWYPMTPWELRRVVVVDALPKGPHP